MIRMAGLSAMESMLIISATLIASVHTDQSTNGEEYTNGLPGRYMNWTDGNWEHCTCKQPGFVLESLSDVLPL